MRGETKRGQHGDLTHSVSNASGDAAVPYRAQQALKACHRLGSEEARPPFPLAAQEAAQSASTAYHLDLLASSAREACPQIAPSKRSGRLAELDSADAADAAGPEEDSEWLRLALPRLQMTRTAQIENGVMSRCCTRCALAKTDSKRMM